MTFLDSRPGGCLAVIETHPIQYQAPIYRAVQSRFGIPVTAIYGSDFSVAGYFDRDFSSAVRWHGDLLAGYDSRFLSRAVAGRSTPTAELSAAGLLGHLRRLRPSAVLLSGYGLPFYRAALRRLWLTSYPLLLRADSSDHIRTRSALFTRVRDLTLRCLYLRCATLLPVGRMSFDHYRRLGVPETKLVFAPRCVDMVPFQPGESDRAVLREVARRELGLGADRTVLLFSGKLTPVKAVDLLLLACKELPAACRERLAVVLLGDGPLKDDLRKLAAEPPVTDVRFVGFKAQNELSPFFHAADLLVLPSHSESWGLVVNEALHHGVPCVVSDRVACAPDLVVPGATGEVFGAGSLAGLEGAIVRGLELVGRPEVRARCRDRVAGYTAEKVAEGIAEAYWRAEWSARPDARHAERPPDVARSARPS